MSNVANVCTKAVNLLRILMIAKTQRRLNAKTTIRRFKREIFISVSRGRSLYISIFLNNLCVHPRTGLHSMHSISQVMVWLNILSDPVLPEEDSMEPRRYSKTMEIS